MKEPSDKFVSVEEGAAILRDGGICAIPTETVYGLGADAANSDAVLRVYERKGRPQFNPLIVHCASIEMAENLARFSPLARRMAEFWPGPLTLVLPKRNGAAISDLVTAGLDTIAVRVPAHPVVLAVIRAVGRPLAAPSANPSGQLSPTNAQQVMANFGGQVPVIDGGPCALGLESTILTIAGAHIVQLRPGAMPREEIERALGVPIENVAENDKISAPGMLPSHYAPRAALRLNASEPREGEAWIGFGANEHRAVWSGNLSPAGDVREAARLLFGLLHAADASGVETIAVATIPASGLGEAINDRLRRGAAPRDQSAGR